MTLNDFINAHGKKLDGISARILAHQMKGHRQGHRWGEARRFVGRSAGIYLDKLYNLEAGYNREMEKLKGQFENLPKERG